MAGRGTTLRRSGASAPDAPAVSIADVKRKSATSPSTVDGRIALTVGVTGHRELLDEDLAHYVQRIEEFFDNLHRRFPHTPLRVLSPLAEGADRLPVEIALARGYQVLVVLPLQTRDYERDFGDRIAEFRDLLARIPNENVFELPPLAREAGSPTHPQAHADADAVRDAQYQQAGHFVATHCHILLALWDGVPNALPGGTGEVVHYKLTGRGPDAPTAIEMIELPDGGPVAWLRVRRTDVAESTDCDSAPAAGELQWLFPAERTRDDFDYIHQRIDEFNGVPARSRMNVRIPSSVALSSAHSSTAALDDEQRVVARTFETADALSLHYRKVANLVLKLLVFFGVMMTVAYEAYLRLWPIRAMLGVYLGAFALVCVVYVWHRKVGALQKQLDYRALAEGLRVQFFWSLAGLRNTTTDVYLRKQNDQLQWIREALRPAYPHRERDHADIDFVFEAWVKDQVGYFRASAKRLGKTGRWVKLVSLGFFAAGLLKTAVLFVMWNHFDEINFLGHWSLVSAGSLPIVGALIESLSDRMGYTARARQHAVLAGIFARAMQAYENLRAQAGDQSAALRELLRELGREALIENADWLTLRRDRPLVLPPDDSGAARRR